MSASDVVNILIGVAVVALLIVRQLRTRPVRETSAVRIILILAIIGVIEMVDASKHHHVAASAVALIVFGLVLAAGFGAWRATTVQVWRNGDGSAWRKGTTATAALWILAIATHIVIDVVIGHTDKSAAGVASASILLYLAVSLGVQREMLRARAARLA
jgi:predicted histidine transporter YuiF (NhaC family)